VNPANRNEFISEPFEIEAWTKFYFPGRNGKYSNTLVQHNPEMAVTLVDNHDTQPLQKLESSVEHWFKPIAYSLILLPVQGTPYVFYPGLYGASYTDKGKDGNDHEIWLPKVDELETLLAPRNSVAAGDQVDYFDHPNCVGWVRAGLPELRNSGIAVLISNSSDGFKYMELGKEHAGKKMTDSLKKVDNGITLNQNGGANFHFPPVLFRLG
jgi:alpha-amylase